MTPQEVKHITSFEKENGELVTKRIQDGRTMAFRSRKDAIDHARKTRSYIYELFCNVTIPGQTRRRRMYGYAVPK